MRAKILALSILILAFASCRFSDGGKAKPKANQDAGSDASDGGVSADSKNNG